MSQGNKVKVRTRSESPRELQHRLWFGFVQVLAFGFHAAVCSPSAWGWGATSGWFWGGACLLGLIFTYICVPEPKGRTVAELDLLFERKVSARKFAQTSVQLQEMAET